MKKITRRSMLKGSVMAAAALALTACGGSSSSTAASSGSTAASAGSAAASADGIGFPKNETITLVVPGKAGGGSDLAIRYYSEGRTASTASRPPSPTTTPTPSATRPLPTLSRTAPP